MNPHHIKKVTVAGVTYEAIRFTGYVPIDKEIIEWTEEKTGRRPTSLDTENLTIGLAYSVEPYAPYLICNSDSGPLVAKKLKAGRWVVYSSLGNVDLMKNKDYDLLRNDEVKEKLARFMQEQDRELD